MDSDFFIGLASFLFLVILISIFFNDINTEKKKELDIISKTENIQTYDHCILVDNRYYCYNYIEK